MLREVGTGEVVLWSARLDAGPGVVARCAASLSSDERARAARFATVQHAARFMVGRGILRDVLSRHAGRAPADLAFNYGPFGKPELRDTPLHFNISHSGDELLIGIAKCAVGVDLEGAVTAGDLQAILHVGLSSAERAAVERHAVARRPHAILTAWTRKEAWLKALGVGLLGDASAGLAEPRQIVDLVLRSGYVGALATPTPIDRIRHLEWTPTA